MVGKIHWVVNVTSGENDADQNSDTEHDNSLRIMSVSDVEDNDVVDIPITSTPKTSKPKRKI